MGKQPKSHLGKIYCQRCGALFDSREQFNRHLPGHDAMSCESCPLDVAMSKLVGLFRRKPAAE